MEAMFVDVIQYSLEQVVSTFGCLGDLHRNLTFFIRLLICSIIKYCQTLLECLEGKDKTQIVETIEIESTDNKSSDI